MMRKSAGIAFICLLLIILFPAGTKTVSAQSCPSYDNDGDGYPELAADCSVIDCNDSDPAVNPGATEVLFNGKDDDCDTTTFDGVSCAWESFSAGIDHTVALKSDGSLWSWGWNDRGQLGDDTIFWSSIATRIGLYNDWISVAAGYYHTAALKSDGTLWIWGWNGYGQLGDGSTTDRRSPDQMGSDNDWIAIAAGHAHTIGLRADGTIWAWGMNNFGQLGDGTTTDRHSPVQTGTDSDWVSIAAGAFHTVGRKSDGTIWAWGANTFGQIGDGTTINRLTPVQVGTNMNWNLIAVGYAQTYAIRNGTLWTWGWNKWGALGDGTTVDRLSPVQVGTDFHWVAVDGGYHTIALKSDGTLWAWGYNSSGELGDGTMTDRLEPFRIGAGGDWVSITTGVWHTIASQADGTLWGWGMNSHFQLGTNESGLYPRRIERINPAYDYDGDSYDCSVDCDNDDPSINPDVSEIPYDGTDQNCDGADGYDIYGFSSSYVLNYYGDTGLLVDWFLSDFHTYSKLSFGPDGYLYGMEDNGIYQREIPTDMIAYDVTTGEIVKYGGLFSADTDLVFGPDGYLYGLLDTCVRVYDALGCTHCLVNEFCPGINRESRLAFGPDGYLYASYGQPGYLNGNIVNVIDITTGEVIRSFPTDFDHSYGIAFGPDGYLYGYDPRYPANMIKGYDPSNGILMNSFPAEIYPPSFNFVIDSDGYLYTFDYGGGIFVYNISTGSLDRSFLVESYGLSAIAIGPRLIPGPLEVRVDGMPYPTYYSTIQDAYNDVPHDGAIQIQAVEFYEDLNFDLNDIVFIASGYDSAFLDIVGATTINGTMTISDGTVIIVQAYSYNSNNPSVTVINGSVMINAGSLIILDGNLIVQ